MNDNNFIADSIASSVIDILKNEGYMPVQDCGHMIRTVHGCVEELKKIDPKNPINDNSLS